MQKKCLREQQQSLMAAAREVKQKCPCPSPAGPLWTDSGELGVLLLLQSWAASTGPSLWSSCRGVTVFAIAKRKLNKLANKTCHNRTPAGRRKGARPRPAALDSSGPKPPAPPKGQGPELHCSGLGGSAGHSGCAPHSPSPARAVAGNTFHSWEPAESEPSTFCFKRWWTWPDWAQPEASPLGPPQSPRLSQPAPFSHCVPYRFGGEPHLRRVGGHEPTAGRGLAKHGRRSMMMLAPCWCTTG